MIFRPLFVEHSPEHFAALKGLRWIGNDDTRDRWMELARMFYRFYSAPLSHPVRSRTLRVGVEDRV